MTAHILPVDEDLPDAAAASTTSSDAALPPPTFAAVAVALAVGALLFALALFANRSRSRRAHARAADAEDRPLATADATAAATLGSRVSNRSRLFVESHVAAHDVVLFVDAASRNPSWPHFRTLLCTVLAPLERSGRLALVDLEAVAHGASILSVLQRMHASVPSASESASEAATASPLTEFLFVRGALVGDYRRVKALLFTNALADALACEGAACDMDTIRVDRYSSAGFIVLGPRQCVQSITCGERPRPRAFDPLVETRPLDTVDELLRHTSDSCVATSAALLPRVPLAERARSPTRRSRLLVCHDMKGGYLDDRFTQGSAAFDAYRLYQWDLVDVFVYFGHHLVCIPPLGWIAAGHRNGVRVLGAVVLEGDSGSAFAAQLFRDRASAEQSAAQLAAIADLYGFDGYLVNIESNMDEALVSNVLVFLQTLRAALQAASAQAQVIWYASLAPTGKRTHQRRLDSAAAPFFACVDGLFTDYGWTLDDAKVSAARDLDRRFDVYMGIDVFGRHGTLGGGKLTSDVALRAAWNAGVSAALFAPGWTHECLQHEASEDFVTAEDRFWTVVRTGWRARSPCFSAFGGRDALYSAFNVGRGTRVWVDGVAHSPQAATAWSNLLEMDQQPVAGLHAGVTVRERDSEVRAVLTHDTAFQGGACVAVEGTVYSRDRVYVKLFDTDIALSARRVTHVSYTTAQATDGSVALLVLTLCPGLDRPAHQVVLRSDSSGSSAELAALSPVAGTTRGKHFYAPVSTRTYDARTDARATGAEQLAWVKRTYRLGGMLWDAKHIVEIGLLCTQKTERAAYRARVGEVCIAGRAKDPSQQRVSDALAAEPVACVDARATWCKRLDRDSVQLQVEWAFDDARATGNSYAPAVQYVLVYARDCSDGDRSARALLLLGKSFGKSFTVESCPWPVASPRALLRIELVSVSWTGVRASGANVCSIYLDEEDVVTPESEERPCQA